MENLELLMMTHTKNAKCEFDCFIRRFLIATNYRAQMCSSCRDFQLSRDLRGWWESSWSRTFVFRIFSDEYDLDHWHLYLDDNIILLDIGNVDRLTFQRYFSTRVQTVFGKMRNLCSNVYVYIYVLDSYLWWLHATESM